MPVTSPDSISYPDGSTTGGFIAAITALATSIQAAFSKRGRHNYQWADATARGAQTGMIAGDEGYQADVAITYRYNGSAWKEWESDWITWTPTFTNLTNAGAGNATTSKYRWIGGGEIQLELNITLGASPTVGAVTFTPPVTLANPSGIARVFMGDVTYIDEGSGSYTGCVAVATGGATVLLRSMSVTTPVAISSTSPFTFGATDKMLIRLRLPVA